MAAIIDRILRWLRWPLAALSLAAVPGLLAGLWDLACAGASSPAQAAPFVSGLFAYWICDRVLFRRRFMGSAFPTLEHELTHAVMAWLCLRGVSGLKVTWSKGGHIRIRGGSNWLIDLGPYFFPTISVTIALLLGWLPPRWLSFADLLLGASLAFHLITTWRATRLGQADLKNAGRRFSAAFLPGAVLLWHGGIAAFALGQTRQYVASAWEFYR